MLHNLKTAVLARHSVQESLLGNIPLGCPSTFVTLESPPNDWLPGTASIILVSTALIYFA